MSFQISIRFTFLMWWEFFKCSAGSCSYKCYCGNFWLANEPVVCSFRFMCLKQFNWILITYDFFILTEANSEAINMDQEQVATVSLLYSICPLLFLAPTSVLPFSFELEYSLYNGFLSMCHLHMLLKSFAYHF